MLEKTRRWTLAGLLGLLLGNVAQAAEPFKVVTTFTVIADMARNVAGDAARVESITKPGAEIHNYQPTPGDLLKTRDAQLVLWNGPAQAETYRRNAEAYKARITATLEPLRQQLQAIPEQRRWLVSSEGAFSYLARDLGLRELYLWPINADAQGTPQQVRRVIETVRAERIPAVFSESTVSAAPAEQVARESGARYGGVLYVDSLSAAEGPVPTYLDLLRVTTETLVKGLAP